MTNGETLIVRGALKPISTLTKPLRSVDTETKEPAQALRERTDSTVVPAAGVVAEAMVALVLARGYREKFGGDHIDDVLAAARGLQGADRVAARERGARPIVFIGFMGAGKSRALATRRGSAGSTRSTPTMLLAEELGEPIAGFFAAEGEEGFRRREDRARRASARRRPRGRRLGGRRGAVGTGPRGARAAHRRLDACGGSTSCGRAPRGSERPLARDAASSAGSRRARAALRGLADAVDAARPSRARPRSARCREVAGSREPTPLLWAASASGSYPVWSGPGDPPDRP